MVNINNSSQRDLLRNQDFLQPDINTGRMVRSGNPEVHINRLHHFAAGLGAHTHESGPNLHIAENRPGYSSKVLVNNYLDPRKRYDPLIQNFAFDRHDEGLTTPRGVMMASQATYRDSLRDQGRDQGVDYSGSHIAKFDSDKGYNELTHRMPYQELVTSAPQHRTRGQNPSVPMRGELYKAVNRGSILPFNLLKETWGDNIPRWRGVETEETTEDVGSHPSRRDALNSIESRFRSINFQNREDVRPQTPENRERLQYALDNPNEESLRFFRRTSPNMLGPQFVNVWHMDESGRRYEDMLDLQTGNWAKLDPEEYFPFSRE